MMPNTDENPFASHENYTVLTIECDQTAIPAIELYFEAEALSQSYFEREKGAYWQMDILLPGRVESIALESLPNLRSHTLAPLEMQDWVTQNQKDFPPIEVEDFYIHGSHLPGKPAPAISLQIDAGRAFGTGEHATTAACLLAIQQLHPKHPSVATVADIGCGTGILALAARCLWPQAHVIAADIDAPSVEPAQENATINHITGIQMLIADGVNHPDIQRHTPLDLLIANILAGPLVELAESFTAAMHPAGRIILSGLLTRQAEEVQASYLTHGWKLEQQIDRDEWSALILSHT